MPEGGGTRQPGQALKGGSSLPGDIRARLPQLLREAIVWGEACAQQAAATGAQLTKAGRKLARRVGVQRPARIRVVMVDELPLPEEPALRVAALRTGLLGSHMAGLTLGYAVFVVRGEESVRLFSHEFRHVHQYEAQGSISAFLTTYVQQISEVGYDGALFEIDARAHEIEMV